MNSHCAAAAGYSYECSLFKVPSSPGAPLRIWINSALRCGTEHKKLLYIRRLLPFTWLIAGLYRRRVQTSLQLKLLWVPAICLFDSIAIPESVACVFLLPISRTFLIPISSSHSEQFSLTWKKVKEEKVESEVSSYQLYLVVSQRSGCRCITSGLLDAYYSHSSCWMWEKPTAAEWYWRLFGASPLRKMFEIDSRLALKELATTAISQVIRVGWISTSQ